MTYAQANEEQQVKQIHEWFTTTNQEESTYQTKEVELNNLSTEGGSAKGFFSNHRLVKIEAKLYGETGNWIGEYYYHQAILYFVFTQTNHYNGHILAPKVKISRVEENRYYFWEGKMIRWLDQHKKKVDPHSQIFKNKATEIRTLSHSMQAKFVKYKSE